MADLTQNAANVAINDSDVKYRLVQFGEAVTQGMPVYRKAADGKYWKAQNDGTAAEADVVGIALTKGAANGWGFIATEGNIDIGATLAVGQTYCLSNGYGTICPVADVGSAEYPTNLGVASSTSNLMFKPQAGGVLKA